MSITVMNQVLGAAEALLEYEHETYTEALRKWGAGNPHRWMRLKAATEKTAILIEVWRAVIAHSEIKSMASHS